MFTGNISERCCHTTHYLVFTVYVFSNTTGTSPMNKASASAVTEHLGFLLKEKQMEVILETTHLFHYPQDMESPLYMSSLLM